MAKQGKILICDDDPLLLDLVSFRLSLDGYDVTVLDNGLGAVDAIEEQYFDVVILDSMMPGLDGFEVLYQIRQRSSTSSTPVVMLSARSSQDAIVGALRAGANDYIVKPFIPEELSVRVARLVPKRATTSMVA